MNPIVLPPKRFEDDSDPKYDNIRHKKWFWRLRERRSKLPALKQAYLAWKGNMLQQQASIEFGVDPRELRDYIAFYEDKEPKLPDNIKTMQAVMDEAYRRYCESGAERNIREYLAEAAPLYGLKARHVVELWEVGKSFYPQGYVR